MPHVTHNHKQQYLFCTHSCLMNLVSFTYTLSHTCPHARTHIHTYHTHAHIPHTCTRTLWHVRAPHTHTHHTHMRMHIAHTHANTPTNMHSAYTHADTQHTQNKAHTLITHKATQTHTLKHNKKHTKEALNYTPQTHYKCMYTNTQSNILRTYIQYALKPRTRTDTSNYNI